VRSVGRGGLLRRHAQRDSPAGYIEVTRDEQAPILGEPIGYCGLAGKP